MVIEKTDYTKGGTPKSNDKEAYTIRCKSTDHK